MAYVDELLDKHSIGYILKGSDYVVSCMNPEHSDNNPSMHIDRNTGRYHCFSCGFKGGIAKLLNILGEEPPAQQMFLSLKIDKIKESIFKLRKISPTIPADAEYFDRDYRDIAAQTYKDHNAFITDDPTWKYRLCFPIYNNYKEFVFIEGRSMDSEIEPKYLRKPSGAEINFLYNINCGAPTLVLVEGFFDYLKLYDLGIRNVCPLFGLNFNKFMLKEAKIRGIQGIISMLDNDGAGKSASAKIKNICSASNLVYKRLPPASDPGDIDNINALNAIVKYNNCRIQEGFILC